MLELLELVRGACVPEIGAGTGYNAALMAEIVGEQRLVVTAARTFHHGGPSSSPRVACCWCPCACWWPSAVPDPQAARQAPGSSRQLGRVHAHPRPAAPPTWLARGRPTLG